MTFQNLRPLPQFNVVLEVFVSEGATTLTLILGGGGGGGRDNVRGKENVQNSIKSSRMFRIVLSPAGFPNFCYNFCLALLPCDTSSFLDKDPVYKTWALTLVFYDLPHSTSDTLFSKQFVQNSIYPNQGRN